MMGSDLVTMEKVRVVQYGHRHAETERLRARPPVPIDANIEKGRPCGSPSQSMTVSPWAMARREARCVRFAIAKSTTVEEEGWQGMNEE
jgi:hypothetical protein